MKTRNIIIYIIICLIIIAGLAVWKAKGFKTELQYSSRKQLELSNYTGINKSDVEQIASDVLGNTKFFIQDVEYFGNDVIIVAEDMTEEQKNQIIDKFNEKYGTKLESDKTEIKSISYTRIEDLIKPFIWPGILTLAIITIYFIIRYKKLGWMSVLLKTILIPVIIELVLFSILAIVRVPLGRITIAIAVSLYALTIFGLTIMFENKREKKIEELENNKQ